MSDDLEILQVGQPINRHQEAEGARLTWVEDHCELVMAFANLKTPEVKGVEQGVFEFGLNVIDQMPFVCFRIFQVSPGKGFGKPAVGKVVLPWQECPFHLSRFDLEMMRHFDEFRAKPKARLGIATKPAQWPCGLTTRRKPTSTVVNWQSGLSYWRGMAIAQMRDTWQTC